MNIIKSRYWFSDYEIKAFGLKSEEKAREYISQRAYQSLRPTMDNIAWNEILRNKLITSHFLRSQNIPYPRFYGYLNCRDGVDCNGKSLKSGKDLFSFLDKNCIRDVVIKHVGGGRGDSVYLCHYEGKRLMARDGSSVDVYWVDHLLENKYSDLSGYIVEESLAPHEDIKDFNGDNLHSIRIQTLRSLNGRLKVQNAYLRMGCDNKLTDHAVNGGVMALIDLKNGQLHEGLTISNDVIQNVSVHPNTGVQFSGREVPLWKEVLSIALQAASAIPGVHYIGWDIVVGTDGAKVIEGNVGHSMYLQQLIAGPFMVNGIAREWSEELGAELPDGSLGWCLRHWDKGRRLSMTEQIISRFSSPVINNLL